MRREEVDGSHEKPTQPDAFASAGLSDAVHSVVPVARPDQRQTVFTGERNALVETASAMFEQRRRTIRPRRQEKGVILAGLERRALQKRNDLVKDRSIP